MAASLGTNAVVVTRVHCIHYEKDEKKIALQTFGKTTKYNYFIFGANRKKGNDKESIQLPNTFRPRRQRERRTHLKQRHNNQNTTSRKPKGQFLSQIIGQTATQNTNFTRTYMHRHIMTEIVKSLIIVLERLYSV